jgi:hypothetical protein
MTSQVNDWISYAKMNQAYTDTRYPREIAQENLILPSIQTAKMFQEAAHDLYNIVNDILNAEGT